MKNGYTISGKKYYFTYFGALDKAQCTGTFPSEVIAYTGWFGLLTISTIQIAFDVYDPSKIAFRNMINGNINSWTHFTTH